MLIHAKRIPHGACLEADVCIIGGGAAGITIARSLDDGARNVLVVAGGGFRETAFTTDLYTGVVEPPNTHEPLQENRVRAWGGSTVAWGGRCIPYDEIDFRQRDWIPHSGWPLSYHELLPFINEAVNVCEAGRPDFDARSVFPGVQAEILSGIDGDDMHSWPLERWSPPTNFATRYGRSLVRSPRARVVLDGHVVRLAANGTGTAVTHALVSSTPTHVFEVKAPTFVLAAGGLENPRLLLASNDVIPAGLGNGHDLVGRFYQSHRFGVCGEAVLRDPMRDFIYEFERDSDGVYCRRRFRLSDAAQEAYRIGNAIAFFARPGAGAAVHRNAVTSSVYLVKTLMNAARHGPIRLAQQLLRDQSTLAQHAKVVMTDGVRSAPDIVSLAIARFGGARRLPSVLPPRRFNHFHLYYQTEHAPNRDSRVTLADERDALGMPRLSVRVAFSPVDFETVRQLYRTFARRFAASGAGSFTYSVSALEEQLDATGRGFNSNAHHIGTTRMADIPSHGVVDRNCRVHGVRNLFVSGASVFPTSGHANPTLMIVSLALRLAAYLKEQDR
jgi:choline dehydrogenase-like flavoprotein